MELRNFVAAIALAMASGGALAQPAETEPLQDALATALAELNELKNRQECKPMYDPNNRHLTPELSGEIAALERRVQELQAKL